MHICLKCWLQHPHSALSGGAAGLQPNGLQSQKSKKKRGEMVQIDRGNKKDEHYIHNVIGMISSSPSQNHFMIFYHTLAIFHITFPTCNLCCKIDGFFLSKRENVSFSLSYFHEWRFLQLWGCKSHAPLGDQIILCHGLTSHGIFIFSVCFGNGAPMGAILMCN